MTAKRKRYNKIFILGLLAYLLIMLGITAESVMSIYRGNNQLVFIAEEDMAFYQENGSFQSRVAQRNANNFVYAPDGSRTAFQDSYMLAQRFDVDGYAQQLSRQITDGKPVFRLKFSPKLTYHIAIAIALPMEDGGLFLFLKELPEANNTLMTLYFAVTLLFVLIIFYLLFTLRSAALMEKAQREYIDNINHELKSPVAAVKALAEPIHDGLVQDGETLRKYSAIMLSELSNLERTISDMLELSRLQNSQIDAAKERLSAHTVFGDILEKYAVLCDEFGLSFTVSPPPEQCPALHTNGALASRLLDILLNNAFKFTGANGRVGVTFTERPKHLVVTVLNDGPAIAPEDRKRIFERFYQGGKAHDKRGSGLGLSIAKEIAVRLDEQLRLDHSVPGDTAFSFTVQKS